MILANPQNYTVTPTSGSVSQNITTICSICYQVIVTATTPTTTFDVELIDKFGNQVMLREDLTGLLNDSVQLLTYGNWTLNILNASVDEAFEVALIFRES